MKTLIVKSMLVPLQVVTLATEDDMYRMFDMFEIGQMAIVLTSDDVFIRTRSKWRQVKHACNSELKLLAYIFTSMNKVRCPKEALIPGRNISGEIHIK